jgi:hypothetical protein
MDATKIGQLMSLRSRVSKSFSKITKAVECMAPDVEYVVITNADFTYPTEYVPEIIQILEDIPKVGMICGNRFSRQTEGTLSKVDSLSEINYWLLLTAFLIE